MATLGKTATPNGITHGWIQSNSIQSAMLFTMPAGGGLITAVSFWAATKTPNSDFIWGVVWDSSGNVLANGSGVLTSGGQAANPGGSGVFYTDTFATPLWVAGGTQLYIGFQTNSSVVMTWAYNGGDHSPDAQWRTGVTGSPTTFSGHSAESPAGAIAAYATYTPGSVFGDDGGAFQGGVLVFADDGAGWQQCEIWIDDGVNWQRIG
jgi:hypothetical protein